MLAFSKLSYVPHFSLLLQKTKASRQDPPLHSTTSAPTQCGRESSPAPASPSWLAAASSWPQTRPTPSACPHSGPAASGVATAAPSTPTAEAAAPPATAADPSSAAALAEPLRRR